MMKAKTTKEKQLSLFEKDTRKRTKTGRFTYKEKPENKVITHLRNKMVYINRVARLIKDNGKFTKTQINFIIQQSNED
jgi:hypothetical protein